MVKSNRLHREGMLMDIAKVKGIGSATAKIMAEHGLHTVEDLVAGGIEKLLEVPGFGSIRAARVIGEAKSLVAVEMPAGQKVENAAEVKKPEGEKSKKKSKKKDKKKTGKKISKIKEKEKAAKGEKSKKKKNKKLKKSKGKKVKKG